MHRTIDIKFLYNLLHYLGLGNFCLEVMATLFLFIDQQKYDHHWPWIRGRQTVLRSMQFTPYPASVDNMVSS